MLRIKCLIPSIKLWGDEEWHKYRQHNEGEVEVLTFHLPSVLVNTYTKVCKKSENKNEISPIIYEFKEVREFKEFRENLLNSLISLISLNSLTRLIMIKQWDSSQSDHSVQ